MGVTLSVSDDHGMDMRDFDFSSLFYADSYSRSSTIFTASYGLWADQFRGTDFKYDSQGVPIAGTVTSYAMLYNGTRMAIVSGTSIAATKIVSAAQTDSLEDDVAITSAVLSGHDVIDGGEYLNYLNGYAGNDIISGGQAGDQLFGDVGNDTLYGKSGHDYLFGGNGNDTLNGGGNFDTLDGGSGCDTVSYAGAAQGVTVIFSNFALNTNDAEGDQYYSIENVTGSSYADTLEGSSGANVLNGGYGNDVLMGAYGNDILIGGGGGDSIDGGSGTDKASYAGASVGVTASLANPALNSNDATGDTYRSIEGLIGSDLEDRLLGNSGVNTIEGGAGNDTVNGGAGADKLYGGLGVDTVSYAGSKTGVVANLSKAVVNTNDAAGDSYSSVENLIGTGHADKLYGNTGVNIVAGGGGNDLLHGYAGNDVVQGGSGADQLYGGYGADRFVFKILTESSGNSFDTIFDFLTGEQDRVDLSAIDASASISGNQAFKFISTAAFSGTTGELRYVKQSSDTYIYADVNGDKAADLMIHLDDAANLTKDYFIL
ncbi:protease [Sinorhizobium meliloti]|nr:protease [Sinorhizobium meliloti]